MRRLLFFFLMSLADFPALAQKTDANHADIVGIGAYIVERDGSPVIYGLLPECSAMKSGLIPYDKILQVDDRFVDTLSLKQVVALIRGPQGSVVKIIVERAGSHAPLTFSVTRDVFHYDFRAGYQPADKKPGAGKGAL